MDKINNQTPLTSFKALSFDCYGTLINWEPSVTESLSPILTRLPADHAWRADPSKALQRLMHHSDELEKGQPTLLYNLNLAQSFEKTAREAGVEVPDLAAVAKQFGDETPGKWPAFADSVDGLKVLGKHYKLIILSNITRKSIDETTGGPLGGAKFDAVYTAEEIGSYKPAHQNFHYLFQHAWDDLGIKWDQGDLLHVAHSVPHDHVPSKELGLRSAWISRGGGLDLDKGGKVLDGMIKEGKVGFEWHFDSIGDFAKEVERQFAQKE